MNGSSQSTGSVTKTMVEVTLTESAHMRGAIERIASERVKGQRLINALDALDIEWYMTGGGDLMLKTWQVGAEKFVSPEEALQVMAGRSRPYEADALDWVSRNLDELRRDYAGRWIAVLGQRVIASGATASDLLRDLGGLRVQRPFITQIPSGPVRRYTAYASH